VRRADLREIDSRGVTVDYRGHAVRLHGDSISGADPLLPLAVELDGIEVAGIRFRRNGRLMAAATYGGCSGMACASFLHPSDRQKRRRLLRRG